MDSPRSEPRSAPGVALAWAVHALTATGVVLAYLALRAIEREEWRLAMLWLVVALSIDGIDGSLARWARVKKQTPRIDGDTLDLIIDFLTYVLVPTMLIVRAELVPAPLASWLAALILVSSLYCFARRDLKTEDNYFRGFPALWGIVALYLLVAQPGARVGALVIVVLALLTFAPIHFIHPFRVTEYGRWPPVLALVWAGATGALLYPGWVPATAALLLAVSLTAAAVLIAFGLLRSLRGPL